MDACSVPEFSEMPLGIFWRGSGDLYKEPAPGFDSSVVRVTLCSADLRVVVVFWSQ